MKSSERIADALERIANSLEHLHIESIDHAHIDEIECTRVEGDVTTHTKTW